MKNNIYIVIVIALGIAACDGPWDDVPGCELTPVTEVAGTEDWWQAEVEVAVEKWNAAIEARGCDVPFVIVPQGGHPVVLVAEDNWSWDDGYNGMEVQNERIDIRDFPIGRNHRDEHFWPQATLLHELGHVMGMDHVDGYEHVMYRAAFVTEVPEDEVQAAAELLGCR